MAKRVPVVFYVHEVHQWSALTRTDPWPPPKEDPDYEFLLATRADLPDLEVLGTRFTDAGRHLDDGHRLCLVRHRGRLAFSAWLYSGTMPTNASPSGWVSLPPDTLNLEDSMAHPDFRGTGLAAFAWTHILAEAFADPEVRQVVTIMHASNLIVRRAAIKMGFREFATVEVTKTGCGLRHGSWRNRRPDGPFLRNQVRVSEFTGTDRIPAADTAAQDARKLRELLER